MAVNMFMPAPMLRTTRPMHMESMFCQDRSRAPSLSSSHRSADSLDSSVASPTDSRYGSRPSYSGLRSGTPATFDSSAERSSIKSFSFSFKKPRWSLFKGLHRRNQSSTIDRSVSAMDAPVVRRKMSISTLTGLHSRSNSSMLTLNSKAPASPTRLEAVPELSSRKCYYSIARNCPGWVIGGSHGDACESCLKAGFFGSP